MKADDVGLHLAQRGNPVAQAVGRGLVKGVPVLMTWLAIIGTAAMLWVGGQIVTHGAEVLGVAGPAHVIYAVAALAHGVPGGEWVVSALLNGVVGLVLGGIIAVVIHQIAKARGATGFAAGYFRSAIQSSIFFSSTVIGSAPVSSTAAWKVRGSNLAPSSPCALRFSRWIVSAPVLYASACPGLAM